MPPVGVALAAAWTAISTAVAAITWAQIGSFLLSQVISWGLSKLLGPKQNRAGERQADTIQMSLGENPREVVFGQIATGGQLVDCGNFDSGSGEARKNRAEWLCLKLADHEVDSLIGMYVNDDFYPFVADGDVAAFLIPGFGTGLRVYFRAGTQTQTPPAYIVANAGWSSAKTMLGCAHVFVIYYDTKDRTIFPGGRPRFSWVLKGAKLYDPRKDSTVTGGSGAHRWGTPSTYEWSENAYLIRYNWVRGIYNGTQLMVGRGLSAQEAPPDRAIARANICDEAVALKAGGTEARYRAGGIIKSADTSIDVEEWLAASMGGLIVDRDGVVDIDPGAAQATVWTITDADLMDGREIQYSPHLNENQRLNAVVARWIDPSQRYADVSTAPRRNSADETADGRRYDVTIDLPFVLSGTQAQRIAEIRRRQGRLERVFSFPLGPKFVGMETGDWLVVQSDRYLGGGSIVGVATAVGLDENWQVDVAIREISSNVYAWTAATDEFTKGTVLAPSTPAPGPIVVDTFAAVASTLTTGAGVDPAIQCTWLSFEDGAVSGIEFQVRKTGDTKITTTLVEDTTSLQALVTAGVGAQGSFDIRARGVSRVPGRVATWTGWVTVATGGSGYGNELIVISGQNIMTKANWRLGGFFNSAAFVESGMANGVSGWGVDLVRAVGNVPEADGQSRVWKQNTDYTLSFTAWLSVGASATLTTDLWSGTVQPAGAKNHTVTATPTWFEWTFQSANAAMLTGCVARFYNVVTNSTTIRITDIMIEEANKASKYAPAPDDVVNANVPMSTSNLVPFSRFEQQATSWLITNAGGYAVTTSFPTTLDRATMKVDTTFTAGGQTISVNNGPAKYYFPCAPSQRYFASLLYGLAGAGALGVSYEVRWFNNAGGFISATTVAGANGLVGFGATLKGFVASPALAVKGCIFVINTSTAAGISNLTFGEPFVTPAHGSQTAEPPFVPGPNADNDLVKVTSPNLVQLSRFELGITGWNYFDGFGLGITVSFGETDGRKWMRLSGAWTANSQFVAIGTDYLTMAFALDPSKRIGISARVGSTGIITSTQLAFSAYLFDLSAPSTSGFVAGPNLIGAQALGTKTSYETTLSADSRYGAIYLYVANGGLGAGAFTVTIEEPAVQYLGATAVALPDWVPGPSGSPGSDNTGLNNARGLAVAGRIYQDALTSREVMHGIERRELQDGDSGSFATAYVAAPKFEFLSGGLTYASTGLTGKQIQKRQATLTATTYAVSIKLAEAVGAVTTQTQSVWTTVSAGIRYECDKPTAANAWDNKYKVALTVNVVMTWNGEYEPPTPGYQFDGYVTLDFYSNDGGGWVFRGSSNIYASQWSTTKPATITVGKAVNIEAIVAALTQHGGKEIAVVLSARSHASSVITGMGSMTYGTATAPAEVAGTDANNKVLCRSYMGAEL